MARRWGPRPAALLAAAMLIAGAARADDAVVPHTARVTDLTGTLSGATVARIETELAALDARSGRRIAVLMLPATRPEDIARFGRRVAPDGAILIVAKDDRRVYIEVGRNLAAALPAAIAQRIVNDTITPHFRAGDYDGGVLAGVDRIIAVADGEPLPPPPRDWNRGGRWRLLLPLLFVLVFAVSGVLQRASGRLVGSLVAGGLAGALAFAMSQVWPVGVASGLVAFGVAIAHGPTGGAVGGAPGGRDFSGGGASGDW